MANKTLSESESETIILMGYILNELVHADGYYDMDAAMTAQPDIMDVYIRYGSTALQTYQGNRALAENLDSLKAAIIAAMNAKDGHEIPPTGATLETYANYTQAALVAICRYRANPICVVVAEEVTTEEIQEKAVEAGWPNSILATVH